MNRDHTVILAPIDGIVTQRSVDVGQTVAASMSAPTLFVIAADLTEMQVNANIDEADVGRIRPGQHVTFRVDAYPTDNFEGTVTQIRLQPVVVQNVTTYGTVITVPNKQLKLKPGMTANVKIEIAKRTNTLRIPNAALRFRPTTEMFTAFKQEPPPELTAFGGAGGGRGGRGGAPGMEPSAAPAPAAAPAPPAPAPTAAPQASASARGEAGELRRDLAGAASGREGGPAEGRGERGGRGGGGGFGGGGGRGGPGGGGQEFQGRMLERLKSMPADEQAQFLARMKERGGDTSALDALMTPTAAAPRAGATRPAATAQAQTIDALFAPLPPVMSRGRAWSFTAGQLKIINLRLGISDGTSTELLSDELQENAEVVTGVTGLTPTRGAPAQGGAGNPLMPGRGGPGGGRPGGGGRGGN